MDIEVLKQKPTLITNDGNTYLDLSFNSYNIDTLQGIMAIEVVSSITEMRLDKIAMKYYNDTKYLDLLCKANNIFNPFSIKVGDVLVIPNIPKADTIYKNKGKIVERDLRDNYVDAARLSTQDKNRIARLKEKSKNLSNAVANPLPTNVLPIGTTNKQYKDGGIILGTAK